MEVICIILLAILLLITNVGQFFINKRQLMTLEKKLTQKAAQIEECKTTQTDTIYAITEKYGRSMITVLDKDLKIKQISTRLINFLGYTQDDIHPNFLESIIVPEDYSLRQQYLKNMVTSDSTSFILVNRMKTKNGDIKYIECYYVYNPDQFNDDIYISSIDVTERAKKEMDLQNSYDLDELLLNSIETKVAAVDKDGKVIALNRAMQMSLKNKQEYHPDLEDICLRDIKIINNMWRVLTQNEKNLLFKHKTKFLSDESWNLISIQGSFSSIGAIIAYTDITESERLDMSIRKNEQMYHAVLERLPIGVVATNPKEGITFYNEEFARLLKLSSQTDLLGKNLLSYIRQDKKRKFIDTFFSLSPEKFKSITQTMLDKEGTEIEVKIDMTKAILDNKLTDIFSIRDIRDELNIKKFKERLDQKEKQIETAKYQTEYFANISHDLRAPINVISSAAQLMSLRDVQRDFDNGTIDKYSEIIKQNCTRLLKLVNNVIDMNKIESGFYIMHISKVNIVNLVEELTLSIRSYTEAKNIELIFDTEVEECIVEIDIDSMERIILNLLSNAVKFTPNGGKIDVRIYQDFPNVIISVKDTGRGIEADKLDIIFERFKQARTKKDKKEQGSGIGLSLVKSLVELQGGLVDVTSVVGEGSEFKVILQSVSEEVDDFYKDITTNNERLNLEFSEV
ncbi:ATP-binding protein [Candidatus Epulonipiscium viviparus]|uniref:PAS domain-containing sensor histidine kinase n=1 Tax=Candidatus Epulonipiscium viviparus TaxID=420336 RepID=UPI002738121D|nr:ATP-binding protein [Candidatus Epulopiscium viviparus]